MGKNNKNKNKEEEKAGTTVGEYIDALYSAFPKEEFLGDPSHHYLFTIPEEQADSLGYLPDGRGHRDDRVKLPAHPSHPSRGAWDGNEFQLTDLGMQSPNYTLFGLNDGGQDPQAILTYKGEAVIPEITVTPNGNYVENPYDNIIMRQKAKDQGPYYVKNYPVVNAEDEGLSEYFMNHKDVAGMAIGGGANGIDGPRRIVMNPYSDVLKTDLQKEGLVRIEAVRHAMDENNYKPSFELSEHQKNLQKTVFKDMPYGSNDEAFKQSIISRILVGDADDLQPTPEQEAEAARFIFNNDSTTANQKGEGGTLDTPKKWDDLSFQEKSEMMKIAIKNGVYSLPKIKQKYNEYAEGGKIHIDESKKGTFTAAATKHGMGVQEFASKVMSNPEDYSPEMRKKAVFAKNAAKWHCYGGNLFGGGGYKPSEAIKKRIAEHEGKAMTGAKDPLSGKYAKNNSFEAEARGFYNALPKDIRDQVLSNQGLADNLYSYSYNVGAGNFKKRVVPTLQKYYKGQASIEDIENSMWASGDSKLRGLQRRRAQERAGVRNALWDYQMNGLNTAINNPMPVFMQDPSQVYNNSLATYEAPVVPIAPEQPLVDAAIKDAYTPEKIAEEERKERAALLGSVLNNFNQSGEYSPFINAINVLTGRGYSKGGHLFAGGGIKKYVGALEDITYDADNMKFYEKATGKELGDSAILDEVIVNGRNSTKDYLTEANDNTSVYNIPHREYNQHLKDRAEQGAREAAIWREEHPNLSAWGEAAASVPLAVASVPLIAGGAEALAGTSAGQAISSGLLSLSNLAKGSTIAGAPAWAWADAGLTSAFGAHGASEIAKGNVTPEALLEVAPLGQLAKPIINAGYTGYNAAKSFVNLAKANHGFAVSTPRIGKIFGKDAGQFTAWVPTDRPLTKGISWINTGEPTAEGVPIQYITSKHSGEGRKLYDAAINKALAEGHPGIITGRNLISAPKTFSTLEHYYPSKVKLDDMGHWSNDSMTGLFEGPKKTVYTIEDFLKSVSENPTERVHFYGAPRYRLERPSTAEITAKNTASITSDLDAAYKAAVESGNRPEALRLLEQAYLKSGIPKTDITTTPEGHAVGWYHGSEWGNHTVFDSSAMNATIGGTSAHGRIKGNFLTTDVPSAMRYAGSSGYSSANVPEYTSPITFGEKIKKLFGRYKPRRLYPAERVGDLAPKPERLFDTEGKAPIDHLEKTDNVVYPMYVNPGEDVMTLDFQGNPWSQSPVVFPNNFYLNRHVRDDIAKTYKDEIIPYSDYEAAYRAWMEDPINIRHGSTSLDKKYFDDGTRSIEGFNSSPRYERVRLVEELVPNTTNGAVQTAAKEGKTSVLMRNVIDSNGGPEGVGYAIDDFVTLKPNQQKLADITYDDNGKLIPLSQRFNWFKDDIRYGLLPFGIGLTGLGLVNEE